MYCAYPGFIIEVTLNNRWENIDNLPRLEALVAGDIPLRYINAAIQKISDEYKTPILISTPSPTLWATVVVSKNIPPAGSATSCMRKVRMIWKYYVRWAASYDVCKSQITSIEGRLFILLTLFLRNLLMKRMSRSTDLNWFHFLAFDIYSGRCWKPKLASVWQITFRTVNSMYLVE